MKRRYYYTYTDKDDSRYGQRWCYFAEFEPSTEAECDICERLNHVIGILEHPLSGLAKGNLKRHLTSGKHMKFIRCGEYQVR